MPDDRKYFDISPPTASAASRPVIPPAHAVSDPMVTAQGAAMPQMQYAAPSPAPAPSVAPPTQTIPVSMSDTAPAPAAVSVVETAPEITNVPVSQPPVQPVAQAQPAAEYSPTTVTPALPGAPAPLDNFPRFGELQTKVDAHPLFSGQKEQSQVKVQSRWKKLMMPAVGLVVFVGLAFLFMNSSAGASYLPFHLFNTTSSAQQVITPVKIVTTPVKTAPVSLVPDTYSGWNTNCAKGINACIRYPSDWVSNPYGGYENTALTQYAALTSEGVADKSTADATVVSVDDLSTPNSTLKVVGLIVGNRPSYTIYDSNYVSSHKMAPGVTANILIGAYTFSGPGGMASLVGTPDTNGDKAITTIDAARAWFVTADAQQVLKVMRSFYYQ